MVSLAENDRARADHDVEGFLKIVLGKRGKIIGATLVGDCAGEMMPTLSLAIQQKLKPSVFLGLMCSYPTKSELFKSAALMDLKQKVRPWQIKWLKRLFFS